MSLAPRWELLINGHLLPESRRRLVKSLRVDASIDGADELVIEATAWDSKAGRGGEWRFAGEDVLAPGNLVVVRGGYGHQVVDLQRFRIMRHEVSYPESGPPTIKVRGYSAEHRMVEQRSPRSHEAATPGEVAAQLAQAHQMYATVDTVDVSGTTAARVKKAGDSDWKWLVDLAATAGFHEPWVRWDPELDREVVHFRQLNTVVQPSGVLSFRYSSITGDTGEILSFSSALSLAGVPTKVEVLGWDELRQEAIRVVLEITEDGQQEAIYRGGEVGKVPDAIRSGGQLQVAVLNHSDDPSEEKREVVAVETITTTEDARDYAARWFRTRQRAFQEGNARLIGDPRVWIGEVHRFEGLAPTDEGLWETQEVSHVFNDSGYRTDLVLSRVLEEAAEPRETA